MTTHVFPSVSSASAATLVAVLILAVGLPARAQETHVVYDRESGELSEGTAAPSRADLVSAIENGAKGRLLTMLEYGERVECHACVPLLERRILEDDDAEIREFAAWWIRRRPFGYGQVAARMRTIVVDDADPVRRARAAEALGEFLDPRGLEPLQAAAASDAVAVVRASAVRALGRLNHPGGNATLAAALEDDAVEVRRAAIDQVLKVRFFRSFDAVISALADDDDLVRRRAALVTGQMHVDAAVTALAALLRGDASRDVRQAAAWSLGRIGGEAARGALREASSSEEDSLVLDAVEIALRM